MPDLTPRQAEMFTLLAEGCSYQDITAVLWVSQSTVNTTIRNARIRLGAATTAEALSTAVRLGLITTKET